MIETSTTWKDTGFDCDHCGGELLKRTDHETGRPDTICYQCGTCGCQWSLDGDMLRIGSAETCKAAQRARTTPNLPTWLNTISRWLWILLAVVAGLALLRFGGVVMLRLLLPLALLGVLGFLLYRHGRDQEWW